MNKKQVRQSFRDSVFKRDEYTCKVCNKKQDEDKLDAHHITDRSLMPNGGYVKTNGISVCKDICHMLVEQYHLQGHCAIGLWPDDLYNLIGSSYDKAYQDSLSL